MGDTKILVKNLNLFYGENHALKDVSMEIKERAITAFIGPSGCGKSTFLKTLNRMNDMVDGVKITGTVEIDGEDIYGGEIDTTLLRKKVGMVFQQPNPFPMSIYDNIAYGPICLIFIRRTTAENLYSKSSCCRTGDSAYG